ncbi:rod-binding protein [Halonatronum saccharophilum]|uniref:rod-binding protein n=1 Tax=Halonatronum saccharophilum TaxID=150060 RepID=UPI0004AEFB63|nr:rod-binding protein [Halonatronum saccharophilum]
MEIRPDFSLDKLNLSGSNKKKVKNDFKNILNQEVEKGQKSSSKDEDLKKVSQEFESIFLSMMFKQMRDAGFKSDLLDSGLSREVFEDMYYDKVAEEASKQGGLGIAELVYQQLSNKT